MQLDYQQRMAVEAKSKAAMVLAGAGSGKTLVLVERIRHLIENERVSPHEIMAFTFTRKAAGEIKNRLRETIGEDAEKVTMGTMHSIALGMIHRFGYELGLRHDITTVYSQWESDYLLREVAIELGYYHKKKWKVPKKQIDEMFARYYQEGIAPARDDQGYPLFSAFIARCKENNALTYGTLLIGLFYLITTMSINMNFSHILVDEVQDIGTLQWNIIDLLCSCFQASLFVVGDIDQSIYEWRGAVPDRLVNKQHLFDVYKLETNYRSVPEIVEKANNLIQHNNNRITKTMVAHRKQSILGAAVCYNMDSNAIADNLKSRDISNTAILARNHILLKKLSQVMTEKGIDHAYIGSKAELTNSEEFRRFHAFLKLIVNPYDNFSFLLIRELIGLSREEYAKIRMTAAQCGKSHFQVWNTSQSEWPLFNNEYELDDIVTYLQDSIELKDICQIAEFIADSPGADTKDYLDWLATYDIQDELEETSGQLQLMAMTVHAAKGLEWDTVIIAGCNEGLIPSKQAVTAGGDAIEAERRLMYVAMTRAADTLVMMVRPELTVDARGKEYSNPISRFIEEAL